MLGPESHPRSLPPRSFPYQKKEETVQNKGPAPNGTGNPGANKPLNDKLCFKIGKQATPQWHAARPRQPYCATLRSFCPTTVTLNPGSKAGSLSGQVPKKLSQKLRPRQRGAQTTACRAGRGSSSQRPRRRSHMVAPDPKPPGTCYVTRLAGIPSARPEPAGAKPADRARTSTAGCTKARASCVDFAAASGA